MNESNTYQAVRIGDIADWRLICSISARGMGAWLKHVNPTQDIITLFSEKWQEDGDSLLSRVENMVYDHPQVLDDFSSDIVIVAPKSIWVPTEVVGEDDDEAVRLYNQVYPSSDSDIMSETVDDTMCLFTLVPGLKAFLQRTFPGARVHPHLGVLVRRFRERSSDMPRLYVDIREGEADYVAFDRKNLLIAATHSWHSPTDIQYHLYNMLNVCHLDPTKVQVSLSGPSGLKTELMGELRYTLNYVMLTMIPGPGQKAGMPLAASLLLSMMKSQ